MKTVYTVISVLFLVSCSNEYNSEKLEQELVNTDREFFILSSESGMSHAFLTYCAIDGILLRPGSMPVIGIQAITALLEKTDDSAFELTWKPMDATVSKSGDLGFTYGIYTMKIKGMDETENGSYVSVWINENGKWKFVLDSGNEGLGM